MSKHFPNPAQKETTKGHKGSHKGCFCYYVLVGITIMKKQPVLYSFGYPLFGKHG